MILSFDVGMSPKNNRARFVDLRAMKDSFALDGRALRYASGGRVAGVTRAARLVRVRKRVNRASGVVLG
jgi:hypothetical protein